VDCRVADGLHKQERERVHNHSIVLLRHRDNASSRRCANTNCCAPCLISDLSSILLTLPTCRLVISCFFPHLQREVHGMKFESDFEVCAFVHESFRDALRLNRMSYNVGMHKPWQKCIALRRDYLEKSKIVRNLPRDHDYR
jgi:hypothetical protein